MRLSVQGIFVSLIVTTLIAGCASLRGGAEKALPLHDEVLLFDLPFDLTYLRTLEAVQAVTDWELDSTVKEKGIIQARNTQYQGFMDQDERDATILLTRVSHETTSIQLAPESQRVLGGKELLQAINKYVSHEL